MASIYVMLYLTILNLTGKEVTRMKLKKKAIKAMQVSKMKRSYLKKKAAKALEQKKLDKVKYILDTLFLIEDVRERMRNI
jgi:hypothetical protein